MKWNRPSKEELNQSIDKAGGTAAVARMLYKHRSTVTKWRTGERNIDYANWELLRWE